VYSPFFNFAEIQLIFPFPTESLNTIVELFKIALLNIDKNDVHFTSGGNLQRRKSRSTLLNVPSGLPRNLSESQLVQIGSKAFSNVAGQFSKLGQSLHRNNSDKDRQVKDKVSDEVADAKELPNPFYGNENSFLPSVGIVMSQTDCEPSNKNNEDTATVMYQSATMKQGSDMTSMSISSVTDNIKMPGAMLCNPDITITDKGDSYQRNEFSAE
jgi:phosphatidylinositol 4-phosphatase